MHSDLRVITSALWWAHLGRSAPLIFLTKEMASLLLDHELMGNTLLTRRFTIHGSESGVKPNDIFRNFVPLGKTLARYARSFELFMIFERPNQKAVIPLVRSPPDLSGLVADPKAFAEEAKFLGSLRFTEKNILATHRNMDMTRESHRAVAQLFLGYNNSLLGLLGDRKPRIAWVEALVDRMNECSDELVRKSTFYPSQATILRQRLLKTKNNVAESFANRIHPHEGFSTKTASVSKAILRGSHLVRSLLRSRGLYTHNSKPVHIQTRRFIEACKLAKLDIHRIVENPSDIRAILRFLRDMVNSRLIWWT